MNPTLVLRSDDNKIISLELGKRSKNINDLTAAVVVYQDEPYSFSIEYEEAVTNITNIELIVNNEMVECKYDAKNLDDKTVYEIELNNKFVFSLVYGLTEILVHIEYDIGLEDYFFTDSLVVAVKQNYEETVESLYDMLNDIYKKNHALLFRSKIQNKDLFPKFLKKENDKFDEEIGLLRVFIQTFLKNYPYFLKNPKFKTETDYCVDYVEKLHSIGKENIQYIVTHPEELKQVYGTSGIYVNKKQMIPEKTLVSTYKYSYDIPENRTIISFIRVLLEAVDERCEKLKYALKANTLLITTKEPVKDNYILSTRIIQQYMVMEFGNYLDEYKQVYKQLSSVYVQYCNVLPCSSVTMRSLPTPSPAFLEIYHYRNIYQIMRIWFGMSDVTYPNKNILMQFSNADKIYEYYCLLNMYDIFISLGFIEQREKRCAYKYSVNHPKFQNTEEENTYYFQKDDLEVILYYQPVIYSYSSAYNNDITLFRTDKQYYTPDFIIKKIIKGEVTYGILDSKWRNRNSLIKKGAEGGFQDSVYKYLYSVVDSKNLRSVEFFWILQGKNDNEVKPTLYNRSGIISRKQDISFRNHSGIVRLTPESGIQELKQIIRTFVSLDK
ncbi:hypothetical protein acsn021_03890 [Anaerocolumna cellulosilytica]|uniref:Uncharacterized protein n=1 Tax=Anaerocolumna cellulosilytica TaxID=433286 RepID=A0A6S6R0K7_9FIRM|nr:DUF2357 domain-containing protein [Anaerocolumna cellulosilytica]MBB5197378.1 hypothetical protein [Anaerocolumna cellulosilytica]BCJ92820.1 hypothetical protein acsn021_03890 [Anaerocolumna cellulosilytica]